MTTTPTTSQASDDPADQAAGLDALLVDAALGRLRWLTPYTEWLHHLQVYGHPRAVIKETEPRP